MAPGAGSDIAAANVRAAQSLDANQAAAAAARVVTSDALLRGESQLAILHERTVYFLRRTRLGKLILTK